MRLSTFFVLLYIFTFQMLPLGGQSVSKWEFQLMKLNTDGAIEKVDHIESKSMFINTDFLPWNKVAPFETYRHFGKMSHNSSGYGVCAKVNSLNSSEILKSLVITGGLPVLIATYEYKARDFTNFSPTVMEINGILVEDSGKEIYFFFPLPLSLDIDHIVIEIKEMFYGIHNILYFRHLLRIYDEVLNINDTSRVRLRHRSWIPSSNYATVSSLPLVDNRIIFSYDDFKNLHFTESLFENEDFSSSCAEDRLNTIQTMQGFLVFKKTAVFYLPNSNLDITDKQNLELVLTINICPRYYSLFPRKFNLDAVTFSDQKTLYWLTTETSRTISEMKDFEKRNISSSLLNITRRYSIIGQTTATHKCCETYILVKDEEREFYILVKFDGLNSIGRWRYLGKFSRRLPLELGNETKKKFIEQDVIHSGVQFTLNGLSFLHQSSEKLYLFGSVLLEYDLNSNVLTYMDLFVPKVTENIVQFVSAFKKNSFALLTSKGRIWDSTGAILSISQNNFALHYNQFDELFIISESSTPPYIKRTKILNELPSTCNSSSTCIQMLLECERSSSHNNPESIHYTRSNVYSVSHPMPMKMFENPWYFLHDITSAFIYSSMTQMFFLDQKTGRITDWFGGGDPLTDQGKRALKQRDEEIHFVTNFRATNNLLKNDIKYFVTRDYYYKKDLTINEDNTYYYICELPHEIYLDFGQEFKFNVTLKPSITKTFIDHEELQLKMILSDYNHVSLTVRRKIHELSVVYEITITGLETPRNPPGRLLHTASLTFAPWVPDNLCCEQVGQKVFAPEQYMLIHAGCPPSYEIKFDPKHSLEILATRGRTENFECPEETDGIPCFTTSEFVAAFQVYDTVTGLRHPFEGKYTLQVVGGGVAGKVKPFTKEEIVSYNFMPRLGNSVQSLIWSILDGQADTEVTPDGKLVFDAKNPHGIVFECERNSPCGDIPFTEPRPSEYYLTIEVSNHDSDTTTNCEFVSQFNIHLIGITLNPVTHFFIMLTTLSVLVVGVIIYYFCIFEGGGMYKSVKMRLPAAVSRISSIHYGKKINPREPVAGDGHIGHGRGSVMLKKILAEEHRKPSVMQDHLQAIPAITIVTEEENM